MDNAVTDNNIESSSTVCRLCGEDNQIVYNVFETSYGEFKPISLIFEECFHIEMSPGDGHPDAVCNTCFEESLIALDFKTTWNKSQMALKSYFETSDNKNNLQNFKQSGSLESKNVMFLDDGDTDKLAVETCSHDRNKHKGYEDIKMVNSLEDYAANIPPFPSDLSGLYQCQLCHKPFFTYKNLQHHMVKHLHNTKCRICHMECYDRKSLKNHYIKHAENKMTLCSWCGGVVTNGCHNFDLNYICPFCNFNFPCYSFLQNHVSSDHPNKELTGDFCVEKNAQKNLIDNFKKVDVTEEQILLENSIGDIIEYKCSECDKIFTSMAKLEDHISLLRCVSICDYCGLKYKLKSQLMFHIMDKHMGMRPHLCSVCGKSFVRKGMLKSHLQVHTKMKCFQCHECGKKFVSTATLLYHSRLHTGEKPYVCSLCGDSFVKSSRLREHEQKWHIGKLQCPMCMTTFSQRCSLKTHMDRFHPNTYERRRDYLMDHNEKCAEEENIIFEHNSIN